MLFDGPIPFSEKREGYTDALVEQILARAGGTASADASETAALEIAAGVWALALAAARVSPATGAAALAVSPAALQMAGRQAIRSGGAIFVIDVTAAGAVRLLPAWSWDVPGDPDPASWWYRCTMAGPTGSHTRTVPAAGVMHLRYASDPSAPWRGVSPMALARATGQLAGNLEKRLGQESGAPVGSVIPVPSDGGVSLVETTSAGFGEGRGAAPMQNWKPRRFGADPPEALRGLRMDVLQAVCLACCVRYPWPLGLSGWTGPHSGKAGAASLWAPLNRWRGSGLSS